MIWTVLCFQVPYARRQLTPYRDFSRRDDRRQPHRSRADAAYLTANGQPRAGALRKSAGTEAVRTHPGPAAPDGARAASVRGSSALVVWAGQNCQCGGKSARVSSGRAVNCLPARLFTVLFADAAPALSCPLSGGQPYYRAAGISAAGRVAFSTASRSGADRNTRHPRRHGAHRAIFFR